MVLNAEMSMEMLLLKNGLRKLFQVVGTIEGSWMEPNIRG